MDTSTRDKPRIQTIRLAAYQTRPAITGICAMSFNPTGTIFARVKANAPTAFTPALSSSCALALSRTPIRMQAKETGVIACGIKGKCTLDEALDKRAWVRPTLDRHAAYCLHNHACWKKIPLLCFRASPPSLSSHCLIAHSQYCAFFSEGPRILVRPPLSRPPHGQRRTVQYACIDRCAPDAAAAQLCARHQSGQWQIGCGEDQ